MELPGLILSNESDPLARGVLTGHCRVEALPLGRTRLHLDGVRLSLDLQLTPAAEGSSRGPLPLPVRWARWLLLPVGALLVALLGWWWKASWQPFEAAATAAHPPPTPGAATAAPPAAGPEQVREPLPGQLPEPPPEVLPSAAPATALPRVDESASPAGMAPAQRSPSLRRPAKLQRPLPPGARAPARSRATTRAAEADLLDLFGDTK